MKASARLASSATALARRAGLEVHRAGKERADDPEPWERRARLIAEHGIDLLLDVGANEGNYAKWLRTVGFEGRIISFEPVAGSFDVLSSEAQSDPLWDCHRVALGESEGELEINVSRATVGSSLLPIEERLLETAPTLEYVGSETVPVRRLDAFADEIHDRRAMLKVDVQGYEMQVFEGAGAMLETMGAIEVELSMVSLYEGSPLVREAVEYLGERGFAAVFLEPVHNEPRTGYTLQADGIFVPAEAARVTR